MSNKHLQHVKSNVVNEDEQGNKSPKLPTTSQLLLGEIGINYANGYERMSIKNDANEIVEFVSKEYVVGKNEIDSIVATSVAKAVNPTGGSQTPEQKALTDAIAEAVAKAIQDAIPTGGSSQTPAQEAMTDAISAAVSQAIKDAISSTSPSSEETDLANAISDAVTKAIQDALSASTPSAEQEALTKAISDAVAKAIQDALDPQSHDKTIVEEIDKTITNYVYKNGGTSISLTDVMTNSHTHSNKSVLDGITQEKVTSWDNASSGGVTNVAYDTTNKKITKTVGGSTTDVVSVATLKSDMNITKSDVSLDNVTNDSQVKRTEMGVANGVATLDSAGKVPSSQLPSYVDDVVEGYYYNSKFYKEAAHTTLITGESNKIYVDLSTDTTYRCSNVTNQTYTQIKGDLALGETETTAYRGDRGKIAYDHSQAAHARVDATNTEASSTNGNIKINGTETTVYTHPAFTAQTAAAKKVGMNNQGHVVLGDNLTKEDVGLGNVGNFKAVSTVANQGLNSTEQSNARANIGAGTSNLVIGTTSGTAADGGVANTHYNNTSNPHSVTKAQVGLGSVVNTGDSATPVSGGTTKFTTGGAYTELNKKVDKVSGKGLSTNDYTTVEKNKLAGIAAGAEVNVQSDWNATSGDAVILNKPTIPAAVAVKGNAETNYRTGNVNITPANIGLGNVGNFKAVSTVANQGLTDSEKSAARVNIGAGTSTFSGDYNDLTNKPESKAAASGGTAVSLVTTGEKYTWNNKQDAIVFNSTYNATTNKAATMSDIPSVPSHETAVSGGETESVVTTGEMYNWNAAYSEMSFLTGSTTTSSVEAISVAKRLVICTATSGQFSLASLPPAGREIHVLVTPTSAASLTIPHGTVNSIVYVNTNDAASGSMSVSANKCGEINAISDGTKVYIRYVNAD